MDQSLTRPSYLLFENKWILEQGFTNLVSGKWQEPKERRPETCYLVDAWHGSLCMIRQFLKGWGIKQAGEKKKSLFCMTHATNFYKSLFGSSHPSHLRPLAATSRAAASTTSRSKAEHQGSYLANSVLVAPLRVARQSYSIAPLGVARPKGAATPTSEKCSPYWVWSHNGATE